MEQSAAMGAGYRKKIGLILGRCYSSPLASAFIRAAYLKGKTALWFQSEMTLGPSAYPALVTLTHPRIDTKLAYVPPSASQFSRQRL